MLDNASLPKGQQAANQARVSSHNPHTRALGAQGGRFVELVQAIFIRSLSNHKPTLHISLFWVD